MTNQTEIAYLGRPSFLTSVGVDPVMTRKLLGLVLIVRRHIVLCAPELWRRVRQPLAAATRFDLGEGLAGCLEDSLAMAAVVRSE